MSQMHSHSLSLMMGEEDAQFICEASRELNLNFGKFIAHMTLLFSSDGLTAPATVKSVPLETQGLYFNADTKDRIWVGFAVKKTKALLDAYSATAAANDIPSDIDNFFPHVTLGCISREDLQAVNMDAVAMYGQQYTFTNCKLAVCKNGEYGKVVGVFS